MVSFRKKLETDKVKPKKSMAVKEVLKISKKRWLEKPVLLGLKRHKRGLTGKGETGWKDRRTVPDTADPN